MRSFLVYDLPTRIFHWIFTLLFVGSFMIPQLVEEKSPKFPYHMLMGMLLCFSILLRLLWGFIGSKHARFRSFAFNPKDCLNYLKGIVVGDKRRWAGHNPASSWATLVMLALPLCLGLTGLTMVSGKAPKFFGELHEYLANALLITVLLHIAGVILHGVRHHDAIGLSMVDGKKAGVSPNETISSTQPLAALIFTALVLATGLHLLSHYDTQTQRLDLFGNTLQLGEEEDVD